MLGKRSRPLSRKPVVEVSGDPKIIPKQESAMSPRTPLDFRTRSPRGWEGKDHEGIGLGIVAAMSSKSGGSTEIPAKTQVGGFGRGGNAVLGSTPIPITSPCAGRVHLYRPIVVEEDEMEWSEDYTCVISHGPLCTKKTVYYNGPEKKQVFDEKVNSYQALVSPQPSYRDEPSSYPSSDFLKFCHLCRKKLQGEDIYMYRGEKAFCSMECRYMQMVSDECTDKCVPKPSPKPVTSSSSSASSHPGTKFFFTSIVAA
ncbi:unnamed protein product [Victoria cruziana]